MDRFKLFECLKNVVHQSQPLFEGSTFNPVDVLLSPVYLESINFSTLEKSQNVSGDFWNHAKGLSQIYFRPLKYIFVPNSNIRGKKIKNPILFFPTEPSHITQFEPIWEELKRKNIEYIIITVKKDIYFSQKNFKRPIIWITNFSHFSRNIEHRKALEKIQKFLAGNKNLANNTIILNSINYIMPRYLKYIYFLSGRVQNILEHFSPRAVVPGYDITPEGRLLSLMAKKSKIPSYCIMHGSITGEPLDTMHIVDHFCLFGEAAKRDLINKGVSDKQLVVTGAPYLDHFRNNETGIHPVLKSKLSLTDEKPYFLIAMSGPGHSTSFAHFQLLLETIFNTAQQFPSIQWVLKLHRKDKIENYQKIIQKFNNYKINTISNNTTGFPNSIFQWLQGATALITGTSTVALEAMSMNIPVVSMDLMSEYQSVDFIELGTTIHVTKSSELPIVVDKLLKSSNSFQSIKLNASNYISDFFHKSQHTASVNIVRLLQSN
jgi:hypothetical protein